MVASFYHEVYEDPLLMLIRRRGVKAGLVVKVRIILCSEPLSFKDQTDGRFGI